MDKEQEDIQFLGFIGIFKESFHIVPSWRKILSQITTFMILPLSFIYLAHIQISHLLFTDILRDEYILDRIPKGTPTYDNISDILSSAWTKFLIFKALYFIFFLVLSLLSTSAVVYTIACIYTAKDTTIKNVMSVVPKVWKRLMATFLWYFFVVFAYHVVAILAVFMCVVLFGPGIIAVISLIILLIIYLVGSVYIGVVWHLASVVSVLEDIYGLNAMIKSKDLIKGKTRVSMSVFAVLYVFFFGIQLGFQRLVVLEDDTLIRLWYGMVSLTLLSILILMGLIIQTIVYFVCKSYHHENIDKSSLADHLEVYLGDYVPLTAKDVQLEHF